MQGSETAGRISTVAILCAVFALLLPAGARGQVFVVEPEHISQQYERFQPTQVRLPETPLTTVGRQQLIRFLQSEQGFAMRPLPVASITLRANGGMEPGGDKYIEMLHDKGIAAQPGQRVQVTNIRIKGNRLILDLNDGPYHRHRFLRHVSVGMDPYDDVNPMMMDPAPSGLRIVLVFPSRVPDLSGEQAEALLKPMIDFGVKSAAEAYAETLPDFLHKAIDEHRVLVGMDRQMVLYAKGEPGRKDRERENGKPFVIWIYGEAPDPVEFVRFRGRYVSRVEIGKVGQPMEVHSQNQMGDYWGKQPAVAENVHMVELGDRSAQDVEAQKAPAAAPTLRNPGEKLPNDSGTQVMRPVKFPPGMQQPGDPGYTPAAQPASAPAQKSPGNASGQQQPAANPNAQQQLVSSP